MTKTYVVTGATSGIGKALVEELIEGDNIIFAGYRNPANIEMFAAMSSKVVPFFIDYDKPETIKNAADFIQANCIKIDTLINAAGCVVAGPVENIKVDEIRHQFNVNVFGHIEFTQSLLSLLENGKIINISSMASYGLFPFITPYCASKKCLDMFFNSLLIENKKNIKVVSIKPGVIATPLWQKSIEENSKYFERFSSEYSKEMKYVLANAERNETRGLTSKDVVNLILKVDKCKNPKLSYTIGPDAFFAHIVSLLPQKIINNIIKLGIKVKIFNNR